MTDEEIIALVQKGKKEEYEEIVRRYEGKLFGYIKRLINQRDEEVEDVLQEVFISAYQNIQGFDCKKKFGSWIYRIAHNRAIDYFKLKKVKLADIDIGEWSELFEDKNKLAEELMIEEDEKENLMRIIGELEVKYREVIMLYFFDDKSYEEMSEILRVPTSNVGVLLLRAKKILKNKLVIGNR